MAAMGGRTNQKPAGMKVESNHKAPGGATKYQELPSLAHSSDGDRYF